MIVIMMIVSDATIWSVTYDHKAKAKVKHINSTGVIDDCHLRSSKYFYNTGHRYYQNVNGTGPGTLKLKITLKMLQSDNWN